MTCADAIGHVLESASDGMRAADIARQINQGRSYERGDGQPLPAYQVSSIAHANRDRFHIADGIIVLQTQGMPSPPAGRRDRHRVSSPRSARRPKSANTTDGTRVILLGCVKQKHDHQAAAKDLYRSRLWTARRGYAEASGRPWLILSAKHGLLDPDARVSPYDVELRTLNATERRDWGERTVRELEQRLGPLSGMTFEVHAGAAYRLAIEPGLERLDANLDAPLARLSIGRQPAWYRTHAPTPGSSATSNERQRQATSAEVSEAVHALGHAAARVSAPAWPGGLRHLDQPGLYTWWVDRPGALALTEGLRHEIAAGLIYAGQTGATKWPSGKTGTMTLNKRIGANHLRGRIRSSTFRLPLASALSEPLGLVALAPKQLDDPSERRLSEWISNHLQGRCTFPAPDALADLEHRVLAVLDPPLNLDGMPPTRVRTAVSRLRSTLAPETTAP
jgi:hypothetical protein